MGLFRPQGDEDLDSFDRRDRQWWMLAVLLIFLGIVGVVCGGQAAMLTVGLGDRYDGQLASNLKADYSADPRRTRRPVLDSAIIKQIVEDQPLPASPLGDEPPTVDPGVIVTWETILNTPSSTPTPIPSASPTPTSSPTTTALPPTPTPSAVSYTPQATTAVAPASGTPTFAPSPTSTGQATPTATPSQQATTQVPTTQAPPTQVPTTQISPTATPVPPTASPLPPTATSVPPTPYVPPPTVPPPPTLYP